MATALVIGTLGVLVTTGVAQSKQADSATAKMKEADMTVLGLRLGENFSSPECRRKEGFLLPGLDEQLRPPPSYVASTTASCFMWKLFEIPSDIKPNTSVVNDKVVILLPDRDRPLYTYGWIDALVVDGNLEMVTIFTGGLKRQDYWLAQLKEKYGEPTSLKEVNKQNGFGAVFASHVVAWRFTNLGVDFEGTLDSTETGSINIVTNRGVEFLTGKRGVDHPDRQVGPKL